MSEATIPNAAFPPEARPMFPGSPYSPVHSKTRRIGYTLVGILIATLVNLGNGILLANVPVLAGARGDYLVATALLPGVYIAFNASANLTLVKARAQFGIPQVTMALLAAYAVSALLLFLAPQNLTFAVPLGAASGMSAAGLTTLSVYYVMQSLPAAIKPLALVVALGAVQFGTPLARFIPVDLLALGGWQAFALIQHLECAAHVAARLVENPSRRNSARRRNVPFPCHRYGTKP